ncbi:ABC transporter permease [Nocardia seriolae]|uniref:ABC transporter permease n=1 Tax=Nocardia seriolae TaxID=37332 RepID=A0A0B8N370_9NOCA|nr:ABC transporter permease [Nocardia seriolae]APA96054.1 Carnitine transport permease protein OpuCB [Nocardia seriolae]MTJ65866.1 ABC transporter permease subunit [Nocardia seriolae]MTJ72342.1 ABC transporter permease subunit [Nocardia seriolae]MTJ86205.1 ABC transporter permease subunit [Nocardia seriolae]MTK30201.1 ABC transporter permease subunit [Nocardia seriolae]
MRYLIDNFDEIAGYARTHLYLALLPLLLGLAIAVPAGALASRARWLRRITTTAASIAYTIPSLALFVILPPLLNIGVIDPLNVVIALTIYSVALLVTAVPTALDSVPAETLDAADAIGYTRLRRVLTVEFPLALPVFVANLRVVAVTNISMVTVGALIGVGGLGKLFTQGYQRDYPDEIIAGILVVLVLALIVDRLLYVLGRLATPWLKGHAA